jgi:hypothetical protein
MNVLDDPKGKSFALDSSPNAAVSLLQPLNLLLVTGSRFRKYAPSFP